MHQRNTCERCAAQDPYKVLEYPFVIKGYSSTSLAMGFANVRAGTQKHRTIRRTRGGGGAVRQGAGAYCLEVRRAAGKTNKTLPRTDYQDPGF